jgi:hypothetical protein
MHVKQCPCDVLIIRSDLCRQGPDVSVHEAAANCTALLCDSENNQENRNFVLRSGEDR